MADCEMHVSKLQTEGSANNKGFHWQCHDHPWYSNNMSYDHNVPAGI